MTCPSHAVRLLIKYIIILIITLKKSRTVEKNQQKKAARQIRTDDPLITSQMLWPTELGRHIMEREGFGPSKAKPTDLQSAPFDRSGTSP